MTLLLKNLMVDIDRRIGLLKKDPFLLPIAKKACCAGVVIFLFIITRFGPVENQPDNIGRVFFVKPILHRRIDHVVRGSHDIAQCADVAEVVAESGKGFNFRHDRFMVEGKETENRLGLVRFRAPRVTKKPGCELLSRSPVLLSNPRLANRYRPAALTRWARSLVWRRNHP